MDFIKVLRLWSRGGPSNDKNRKIGRVGHSWIGEHLSKQAVEEQNLLLTQLRDSRMFT